MVKKDALMPAFVVSGCKDVRTYIRSGNVLFTCPNDNAAPFRRILKELRELAGDKAKAIYRTLDELNALGNDNPFKKISETSSKKLFVTFLSSKPEKPARFPTESANEPFRVIVQARLWVSTTTRNWSTVTKIVEFARMSRPVLR